MLIREPHQDIGERFGLMSGIAALFSANSNVNFEYLVEGAVPEKLGRSDTILSRRPGLNRLSS
jgi:hypothetical protein